MVYNLEFFQGDILTRTNLIVKLGLLHFDLSFYCRGGVSQVEVVALQPPMNVQGQPGQAMGMLPTELPQGCFHRGRFHRGVSTRVFPQSCFHRGASTCSHMGVSTEVLPQRCFHRGVSTEVLRTKTQTPSNIFKTQR